MANSKKSADKSAKASAKVRAAQQQKRQRMQWSIGIIALVVVGVVVLVLARANAGDTIAEKAAQHEARPAPASIAEDLDAVSLEAIAAADAAGESTNPVQPIPGGEIRMVDGKPEVLYFGGEFCPYCAGERWALAAALSKFGEFEDLSIIHSAESDVPTLTFEGSSYTSDHITFTPIELKGNTRQGNSWVDLDEATDAQLKLFEERGGGSFPFIDFGGVSMQKGGSVDVSTLIGHTQTDIAATLAGATESDTDQTSYVGNINLVTGEFIRTICALTDNEPANVCQVFPEA